MKYYIPFIFLFSSGLVLSQTENDTKAEETIPFTWFSNGENSILFKEFVPPGFTPKESEKPLALFTDKDAPAFSTPMPIFKSQSKDSRMITELAEELPKQYLKIYPPKE